MTFDTEAGTSFFCGVPSVEFLNIKFVVVSDDAMRHRGEQRINIRRIITVLITGIDKLLIRPGVEMEVGTKPFGTIYE